MNDKKPQTPSQPSSEITLVRRTLRTVAVLVGACVVFVGALSVGAVAVTGRAVGAGSSPSASEVGDRDVPTKSPTKGSTKKPLSI